MISGYEVSSLRKGLQILDLLSEKRCLKLTEISEQLELNKTTVFRLLHTLEEMNYIIKVDKYYELHPEKLSSESANSHTIEWSTLRSLYHLGMEVEKNIYIGTLDGTNLRVHQVYNSNTQEMIDQKVGSLTPGHQCSLGKVILANMELAKQINMFSHLSLTKATDQTFTDPVLFLHHLKVIKEQQYAADYEEFQVGVNCVAAPVFYQDTVIASISIADSIENMPKKTIRNLARKLLTASKNVTNELNTNVNY
ncbi:IclR family KDG regulon transcriptional repressor [Paenibacillus sp. DS2015]|uniref:IclR family transcriptional regulator n=1 Tax=Paenibacillus sp. DS2015 TaxID=3373917 RepID=UPI003D254627